MTLTANHAAAIAKIHALKGSSTLSQEMSDLLKVKDARAYLRDKLALPEDGNLLEIEEAISERARSNVEKLYFYYSGAYRSLFQTFLSRYEAIRIIRRARSLRTGSGQSRGSASEVGKGLVDEDPFLQAKDIQALVNALKRDDMKRVFESAGDMSATRALFHIEMNLDKLYFKDLLDQAGTLEAVDEKILRDIIGYQVDLLNLNWILRAKTTYGLTPEEIFNYTLPGGSRVGLSKLRSLSYATLKDFQSFLQQNSYRNVFSHEELDRDQAIEEAVQDNIRQQIRRYPVSIAELLLYIHQSEQAAADLQKLMEARDYNVDPRDLTLKAGAIWQ